MIDVVFTNISYLGNAGDYWASPLHYYDFSFVKTHHIHFMDIYRGSILGDSDHLKYKYKDLLIVIGGGGLITTKGNFLQDTLEYLIENNKVILWGVGSNTHEDINWDILRHKNVLLAGVRDTEHLLDLRYLPCVSCKHILFDQVHTMQAGIGVTEHTHRASGLDLPIIKNDETIKNIVNFISSKESIISTSYHGIYWSQLLNKKVVTLQVLDNMNSKMINLRHRVPVCTKENYLEMLSYTSRSEGLLRESRYLNDRFYEEVKEILYGFI